MAASILPYRHDVVMFRVVYPASQRCSAHDYHNSWRSAYFLNTPIPYPLSSLLQSCVYFSALIYAPYFWFWLVFAFFARGHLIRSKFIQHYLSRSHPCIKKVLNNMPLNWKRKL